MNPDEAFAAAVAKGMFNGLVIPASERTMFDGEYMRHEKSAQKALEAAEVRAWAEGFTTAIELIAQMFERDGLHDVAEVVRQAEVRERIEE